jgi:hypothetical protein
MILREFFSKQVLVEGGNLEIDGNQAQQIDLQVHNRAYIVPILSTLLNSIDSGFAQSAGGPLWSPKVLKSKKYLSGSSLHFFNTDIPDAEFERIKPKVGDIDTQVNKDVEPQLAQWLDSVKGQVVGNAKFLGYSRGNEQYSSLWELTDPPIKVQIDFEFVDYEKDQPSDWSGFSHSSSWDDLGQGIKGVFHKFLIQSLSKISSEQFILRKVHKRTGKITDKVETDSMISFAVSSKEGGGLRTKYEPVLDEKGRPLEIDGLPVLRELPPSNYEKDISKIFQAIFGQRIDRAALKKALPQTWSFTGLLDLMNIVFPQEEKEQVLDSFVDKLFARGAQGLYKGDAERDVKEKNVALNYAIKTLGVTPPVNLEQMRQDYVKNYRVATEGPVGLDSPIEEDTGDTEKPAPVKAQLRKGMPHLHDLKPADLLDLLDEIHDGNGNFKLENIPLNVKVDGFGGRFGKNAEGRPFMGTSRTEPRYQAGFVAYHQQKGTTDPEVLGRAQLFDDLFEEMMKAVQMVDSKLGPKFLVNKQVTCEVLYLPFATETPEGKLKFVGIHYDKLPEGVKLALVPFRVTDATTGDDLPDANEVVKELTSVGKSGSVMFIDNSLTQNEALDVTALVPPLENLEQFKAMLASRKRDQAAEVKAALVPVATALEQAIIKDPNIIGKDLLGKDYEGIVINSRLGPIKVTSQEQRDVITAKQAAKTSARTERPRGESKTAVVAVGSFIGHRGHEELFNYTINKAKEVGGNPYLFIGNAESKDDPIPPSVKVETWHKLYPQYAQNISTVQAGGQLIQKIKHELINPLPGKPPRYDNIIIMVGEDRAGMNMPAALMKAVNKFPGYEHVKVSLDVTPRGTGISGTALRNSLKNDPPEKALATWSNAFDVQKLGVDWIKHLMDITRKGMGIQQPQPAPVAEQRLLNALIRPLHEGTSIDSTLRAIINDIGEPITNVYDTMKFQAKKYMENHGELGRGFRMVAAGVGGRWVQNMYVGRLHNELHDLCKYSTRRTVDLRNFLRGEEDNGELEMKRSFGNIANNLPSILSKLGEQINAPQLTRNAQRWMQNKAEYERYIMDLEASGDEQDEPAIKPPKSTAVGQQNAQVDQIVNDVLSKIPKNIAGEIRNAIARAPNKLAALKQELDRHHVKMAEGVEEGTLNELAGYGGDKKYEHLGTHKRYEVYVSKQKFNNLYFIAIAENPRTAEAKFKAKGNNPQEAVDNLVAEIDKEIDVATKVSGQATLDFNVEFTKDILEMSTDVFYAKIITGPRLVIAGPEMMEYPDIMRAEGFKPSSIRKDNGSEGTTKLQGVPLSAKSAMATNLIANGRYVLGDETIDKDGNRVFELNFDSVVQAKNDRMRLRAPALTVGTNRSQGVAEGKVINTYLWHGSRQKIPMLEPRQSVDTGGAAGSNQNAIYATSDPKVAIAMGLTTPGSDTGMFPNDPQMVLFSGKIRKGEYVYLHKLPFNGPDGKPQFVQGGNSREFHSIPGVEGIKPIEIKEIPVNKYLNLIRKATPADLKLRKKYMKQQSVAEGSTQKDMTGQTCEKCKKDKYQERSQHDDMEGKVTCSCGNRVNRWKNYKEKDVAEARMSAAQRLWNAEQKQRAKSDASLARTPSSIPKPEPKRDEKTVPVSEDVENIMDALISKIIFNEAISNKQR